MSAVAAIFGELERRRVRVTADGDALVLKPRRSVDSELLARVREHKPAIIRALSSRLPTCAASCYQIEPDHWIHHPWDGCTTGSIVAAHPRRQATCWHCEGEKSCCCSTCAAGFAEGARGRCSACRGLGWGWIQ